MQENSNFLNNSSPKCATTCIMTKWRRFSSCAGRCESPVHLTCALPPASRLTAFFPLQTRAAERWEAAHGGQRDVPRAETQDVTGRANNSHASHDYRLLRHQKHKRLRLQEITTSVGRRDARTSPRIRNRLEPKLDKQGNSSLLLLSFFFLSPRQKLNKYCDLTMLSKSP